MCGVLAAVTSWPLGGVAEKGPESGTAGCATSHRMQKPEALKLVQVGGWQKERKTAGRAFKPMSIQDAKPDVGVSEDRGYTFGGSYGKVGEYEGCPDLRKCPCEVPRKPPSCMETFRQVRRIGLAVVCREPPVTLPSIHPKNYIGPQCRKHRNSTTFWWWQSLRL